MGQTLSSSATVPRLNILHISLEDFSTAASPLFDHAFSSAGGGAVPYTPNLQHLAANATVFRRAYCQAPICNPSRTSIMTGRRPGSTGVFTNDDPYHQYVPEATMPNLPQFLKAADPAASIACASGSKLFHVACDKDSMGFDVDPWPLEIATLPTSVQQAASFILTPPGPYSADQHRARLALARLAGYARRRTRFYLGVGFVETHSFEQQVCHVDVGRAFSRGGALAARAPPSRGSERLPPLITWPNFDFWTTRTERERRAAIGNYYGCATHVDGSIGAMIGAVHALGLASTTAIVIHGDHGFSLGRHGRWSKYNLYEDATRVPLIIAVPGGRGRVVDDIVESLDVMPTILDLWGVRRLYTPPAAQQQQHLASPVHSAPSGQQTYHPPPQQQQQQTHSSLGSSSVNPLGALTHYAFGSASIPLEGESLLHYLIPHRHTATTATASATASTTASATATAAIGSALSPSLSHARRRRRYARSELHLPCSSPFGRIEPHIGCCMLNTPYDGLPPGFTRTPTVGSVVQLYVRTRRWAYTLVLSGVLPQARRPALLHGTPAPTTLNSSLRIMDEMLFDMEADPYEAHNLAYYGSHAHPRFRMLQTVLRDWNLTPHIRPPLNESRWQRAEWLRMRTGYRHHWWK